MPKIIVYFSRAGENYVSGALKTLAVGNTQVAAEILREITGAESLFSTIPTATMSALNRQNRIIRTTLVPL